jgi:hypothetical protein
MQPGASASLDLLDRSPRLGQRRPGGSRAIEIHRRGRSGAVGQRRGGGDCHPIVCQHRVRPAWIGATGGGPFGSRDSHPEPIQELARLLELHRLYSSKSEESQLLSIDESLARELQHMLADLGYYEADVTGVYDETTKGAL